MNLNIMVEIHLQKLEELNKIMIKMDILIQKHHFIYAKECN